MFSKGLSGFSRHSGLRKRAAVFFAAVILAAGIYARFTELALHFANVDDLGVAEIILKNRTGGEMRPFPIPRFYTYAPFQFVFTEMLIRGDHEYRELLFWGRLPSCVSGILGLFVFLLLCRQSGGPPAEKMFLPLAVLACSWENIIYAKQMHNYAIGVTAAAGVMFLYGRSLEEEGFRLKNLLFSAAALAVLSSMQYQVIVFSGCFYAGLFIRGWFVKIKKAVWVRNWAVSGLVYGILIFPMGFFFLRRHLGDNAGAPPWAWGEHKEFLFALPQGVGLAEKAAYGAMFFAKNFFTVFRAHTAFIPETHALYSPAGFLLFFFFAAGLLSFIFTRDSRKRSFGVFFSALALAWVYLVMRQNLTLGPTRHTLILLPVFCFILGEGPGFLGERLLGFWKGGIKDRAGLAFRYGLPALILVFFAFQYGRFLEDRRDLLDESGILEVLEKYDVGLIFSGTRTDQMKHMKRITDYQGKAAARKGSKAAETIAWISRNDIRLDPVLCEQMRSQFNRKALEDNSLQFLPYPCRDYRLVYARREGSGVQVDFSRKVRTGIYTNRLYFYIVTVVPPAVSGAWAGRPENT